MAQSRLRVCAEPGCPALGAASRCGAHTRPSLRPAERRQSEREYDRDRGSAASRGYGPVWRRLRLMQLRAYPLCADPDGRHGDRIEPATQVDHIIPLRRGGSGEASNLQSLCAACHSRKTNREDGGGHRWATG